jgi:beta-glucosidase-like glycosyl hydrolase
MSLLSLAVRARALLLVAAVMPIAACSSSPEEGSVEESQEQALFSGTPNTNIGQFFMIEHFGVVPSGYSDVHDMIKRKNLGAVILWNPTNAPGTTARQMVSAYSKTAQASGTPEVFYAADQEEHGTQRFKSREGFTDLVDGASLGRAVAKNKSPRVCELHARITAREMSAIGMNMALGTVSDLYTRNSGTPGMFRTRAIDATPEVVTSCITAMTKAYGEEKHVVFITKHFPGLGNASGNTDVDPSVHTYSVTKDAMERELSPYRSATAAVNAAGTWPNFGTMVSHASYKVLDGSNTPATLSPVILEGVLRGDSGSDGAANGLDAQGHKVAVKGMDLKGVTVSDAFWTWGRTKNLSLVEKRRLMAQSFIAGMDILMIAKAEFAGAWDYFQALYAKQLPADEQAALVAATGAKDFEAVHAAFVSRVDESATRIKSAKSTVGRSPTFMTQTAPNANTADLVAEYRNLTR